MTETIISLLQFSLTGKSLFQRNTYGKAIGSTFDSVEEAINAGKLLKREHTIDGFYVLLWHYDDDCNPFATRVEYSDVDESKVKLELGLSPHVQLVT